MSWYLYSYKPLIKEKFTNQKVFIHCNIIIIIIPLFTLGSIYGTNASGAEQIELNRGKNPNRPEANQRAVYKLGRRFDLGTRVDKSSLRSGRGTRGFRIVRRSNYSATLPRCLLVGTLVIINRILKLPEVTVSPAWKIVLTFFGFSYSCWAKKCHSRRLNSLKFGGCSA